MRTYTVVDGKRRTVYTGFSGTVAGADYVAVVMVEGFVGVWALDAPATVAELRKYLAAEHPGADVVGVYRKV